MKNIYAVVLSFALVALGSGCSEAATVAIVFPADMVNGGDDWLSQEWVDSTTIEEGYLSGTLNSDGSATFTMTKQKQVELLNETRLELNAAIERMLAAEPNLKSVTANDDLSEIEFRVENWDSDYLAYAAVSVIYAYRYQVVSGQEYSADVVYIDASTGREIERFAFPME